jgi:tetratricopeptide (TPR) repeat protein
VLYSELNSIRRRRLHQRIGETLEKLHGAAAAGAPGAEAHAQDLAYHFALAGDLARSLMYSRRAARNAERVFAHDDALKFLEQARESAEALTRVDETATIDEEIGDIHVARGVIPLAVRSYESALGHATGPATRAALKAKVGNAYVPIGDPRGLAYLEEALVELDPKTQTNALALATALVGRYYHYRTEHRKAIEFLERARQLAEPLGDAETMSNIYMYLAGAHQHLLQYDDSNRWARAAIELGEREKFPFAVATGNEFLAENAAGEAAGTTRWPTRHGMPRKGGRSVRSPAWPGPSSAGRRACTAKANCTRRCKERRRHWLCASKSAKHDWRPGSIRWPRSSRSI